MVELVVDRQSYSYEKDAKTRKNSYKKGAKIS